MTDTRLTHTFDVSELEARIDDVFTTFYDQKNKGGYYAPYLCFVQSSGMGKTKIVTSCAHIIIQKTIRNQNQKQNKNKAGYCGSAYSLSQSKQWKSGRGEGKGAV